VEYTQTQMSEQQSQWNVRYLLDVLEDIPAGEMTTFELEFLRRFSDNPPNRHHGIEDKIPMAEDE
jgi:hypothetical protein